jgi:meso-butanediol dehydrogenase/(S,S)-butanediol dehydrogenase/diacetyl reductase
MATLKKTAIVTGGGRGIGLAIVNKLLDDGFNVVSCGRSERATEFPENAQWETIDVSKFNDANLIVDNVLTTFGSVDLLINNAGVQVEKTLMDSTDNDWDLVVGVNCRGVFNMSRACLPSMQKKGGNIINIGSISGKVSDPSMALYNASKAFVHGLTRSIAVDHGPMVRCNAIQPGWIMTAMADEAFAQADDPELSKQDALARHPVGRFGKPEDIANMVSFLASENSHYLSGECITVDGGLTAASPLRPGLF